MKRLIGGDILDTVTKITDGSRDKSIDDYKLHEVFQLAFDNAVRPEVDNVLDLARYVGCRRVVFVAQTATFCVVSATCRDTSLVMSQTKENVVSAGCPKRHNI
jgi:hypothetical protein